jgi:uncharacterized integral membrane protein
VAEPGGRRRRSARRDTGAAQPVEGAPDAPAAEGASHTPVTQQVGRIVVVLVATLFVVFALVNAQHVDFSWVFGSTEVVESGGERVSGGVRLIVLLIAAFLAGAVVAGTAGWQWGRHHSDEDETSA